MPPTRPIRYPWPADSNFSRELIKQTQRHLRPPGILDSPTAASVTNLPGRSIIVGAAAAGARLQWFQMLTEQQVTTAIADGHLEPGTLPGIFCREKDDCEGNTETYDSPAGYGWPNEASECQTERATTNPPELVYFPQLTDELCGTTPLDCPDKVPDPIGDLLGEDRLVLAWWNKTNSRWEAMQDELEGDTWDSVLFCPPYKPLEECLPCVEDGTVSNCCIFDGRAQRILPSCDFCEPNNENFDAYIFCADINALPNGNDVCYPARLVQPSYKLTYELMTEGGEGTGVMITDTRPVYAIPVCACGCPLDWMQLEFFTEEEGYEENGEVTNPCSAVNDLIVRMDDLLVYNESPPLQTDCLYSFVGCFCQPWRIPVYLIEVETSTDKGGGVVEPETLYVQPDCTTGELVDVWVEAQTEPGTGCGYQLIGEVGWSASPTPAEATGNCAVLTEFNASGSPGDCEIIYQICNFCYRVVGTCENGLITGMTIQHVLPPGNPNYDGMGVNEDPDETLVCTNTITFTDGSGTTPVPGDTLTGDGSGASIVVSTITITSGTFAGNDAAGTIVGANIAGNFSVPEAGTFDVPLTTCTITSFQGPIEVANPQNVTSLLTGSCMGRTWRQMDMDWAMGDVDDASTFGFPHLAYHMFGGCCQGINNLGGCDPPFSFECNGTINVKVTWSCNVSTAGIWG